MTDLVKEITVGAPAGRVYDAWRGSGVLSRWFAPEANAELAEGAPFEFFWDPTNHDTNSTIGCRLLTLQEEQQIRFNWKGPAQFAALMNQEPLTEVTVDLVARGDETLVRLTHSGWGEGEEWEKARAWHNRAWDMVLSGLKGYVEQGGQSAPYWAG